MNHKDLKKNDDSELIKLSSRSLELLKNGSLTEAQGFFESLLRSHFNNEIAESGLRVCKYWQARLNKVSLIKESIGKGKFLLNEWKKFEKFIEGIRFNKKVLESIMYFIHKKSLDFLKKDLIENRIIDAELIYLTAIANKRIGDYRNAIIQFERTMGINNNANVLAQLADSYALIDEEEKAKLLFREAFFVEPDIIEIESLDSNIIHTIISKLYEFNIPENEIKHWIPIYGRVLNIFNVFRELMPVEYGRLKQEIFYLEKEIENESHYINSKRARLINCYLWLYDYFLIKGNSQREILEIENIIKNLSYDIYNLLKNKQEIK